MSTTELITSGNAGRFAIPSETDLQVVYGVAGDKLAEMKTRLTVPDTSKREWYALAVAGIRECRELRVAIEDKRKELKADSLAYGKAVDKVAKALTSAIEEIEEPIKAAKKREDDRIENERLEHERKERAAIEAEQRKQREAAEAELRKQREAMEAEQRRIAEQQAVEARKLAEERAAVEAERRRQEEAERQRLAEIERQRREAEEAEQLKREAEEREARRVAALPEAERLKLWLSQIATLVDSGPDGDDLPVFGRDYEDFCEEVLDSVTDFQYRIASLIEGNAKQ